MTEFTIPKDLELASPKIAEAICYLFCLSPNEFDPDGELTAAFWPYTPERYEPAKTAAENLTKAILALYGAEDELHGVEVPRDV